MKIYDLIQSFPGVIYLESGYDQREFSFECFRAKPNPDYKFDYVLCVVENPKEFIRVWEITPDCCARLVSFEKFFHLCPVELKKKLIFHLDLFERKNK